MVPLIFEPFAEDIAQRAASLSPGAVLETAAGSGVVTRALAPRLPSDARYIVTDLNRPMLDYAAARQPPDGCVAWRHAAARRQRAALRRASAEFRAALTAPEKSYDANDDV